MIDLYRCAAVLYLHSVEDRKLCLNSNETGVNYPADSITNGGLSSSAAS
jgi:hypothetical protein